MRSILATILVVSMAACSGPYMDLRQPIYLVPKASFWSGCRTDSVGNKECRLRRIRQVYDGVNAWLRYFDKRTRPRVIVVNSEDDVPLHATNDPIYLGIDKDFCAEVFGTAISYDACYFHISQTVIMFVSAENISSVMDHEFGHVLGRDDNDVPEGTDSVMSYSRRSAVWPLDIAIMCRLHSECRFIKRKPQRK